MDKREKVIKGLECCTAELGINQHQDDFCAVCPYKDEAPESWYCFRKTDLMRDALALLKAQESKLVHVTADINRRKIGECPNCGKMINSGDYPNYCGRCGQAVKWE